MGKQTHDNFRSAKTGEFVPKRVADKSPATHVKEKAPAPAPNPGKSRDTTITAPGKTFPRDGTRIDPIHTKPAAPPAPPRKK